jgi:CubicO group peptidase (beta-lactamase class C family)
MRPSRLWAVLAALAAGAAFASRPAPAPDDDKAGPAPAITNKELEDLLKPIRDRYKLPALAAAVVTSKGLVAVAAVGVRKRGAAVAVTVDDQFHLGSDTKALTATLLARLIEEGKLSWDDRLDKAFPDLARGMPKALRGVTLKQLLTHRAGLPVTLPGGWAKVARAGGPRQQREAAVRAALSAEPEAEPGKEYLYTNLGYVVAGVMAERATKKAWEDLMREKVFRPLKMGSAGFGAPGLKGRIEQPWAHKKDGTPVPPGPLADNPPALGPAGTVHCSLPDWAKFVADLLGGSRGKAGLLKSESYAKLVRSPYPGFFYTPGGWTGTEKGPRGRVLGHDGSNTLNYATALLFLDRDLAVLVVTNQGGSDGQKGAHEARAALVKRLLK